MALTYYTADVQKTNKNDPNVAFIINEADPDKDKILAQWRSKAEVEKNSDAAEEEDNTPFAVPVKESGSSVKIRRSGE